MSAEVGSLSVLTNDTDVCSLPSRTIHRIIGFGLGVDSLDRDLSRHSPARSIVSNVRDVLVFAFPAMLGDAGDFKFFHDLRVLLLMLRSSEEAKRGLSTADSTQRGKTEQKIFRKVIPCEFLYK